METAYIKLFNSSSKKTITLKELKDHLIYYQDITTKTGLQLSWEYGTVAFPYIITKEDTKKRQLYLQSKDPHYRTIIIGIDEQINENEENYDQIILTLPAISTHGDKGKANELCKFLAKKLQAELQLFNGRIMYFNSRK